MTKMIMPSTRFEATREAFVATLNEAAVEKFGTLDKNHSEYFERELKLIDNVPDEWLKALLIASDLVKTMKQKHPHCISNGRGAIVASFAAYLLHITEIDPVMFNLQPERFYVGAETSPIPLIDIEIAPKCKSHAIEYLMNTYGKDNVFGCLGSNKHGVPTGIHSCAFFISKDPYKTVPNKNFAWGIADKTYDVLESEGHMRISIISSNIQQNIMNLTEMECEEFNLYEILCNMTYKELFDDVNTDGVMYGNLLYVIQYDVQCFNDLVNFVALTHKRPIPRFRTWFATKNESYNDETIDSIVSISKGHILYQEQICNILQYVLGVNFSEANKLRKAIAKRNSDQVRLLFADFVKAMTDKSMNPVAIMRLWNDLFRATDTAMVRSHCVAMAYSITEHAWLNEEYGCLM